MPHFRKATSTPASTTLRLFKCHVYFLIFFVFASPWPRSSYFGVMADDSEQSEATTTIIDRRLRSTLSNNEYYPSSLSSILMQYLEELNTFQAESEGDVPSSSSLRDFLMIHSLTTKTERSSPSNSTPNDQFTQQLGGNESSAGSGRPNSGNTANARNDRMLECIIVDIYFLRSSSPVANKLELEGNGSIKTVCIGNMCSACLPPAALIAVAQLDDVKWLEPAIVRKKSIRGSSRGRGDVSSGGASALEENLRRLIGSVTSEGDAAMRADVVRSKYEVDGSGIKIGVISDSFGCYDSQAVEDMYSGDLPFDVSVPVSESLFCFGGDEGRAMMQLIHDVAPGASLVFRTGAEGQVSFAQNILAMASMDGCDIIVDDIGYFAEPMFQDGIIAQAVDTAVRDHNVLYFSAAGNSGASSYESVFRPVVDPEDGQIKHNFNPKKGKVDTRQTVRVPLSNYSDAGFFLVFQWDQPYGKSRNDLDIVVNVTEGTSEWVDVFSFGGNDDNIRHLPLELSLTYLFANDTYYDLDYVDFDIQIILKEGDPPGFIKWVEIYNSFSEVEYDTMSGTAYGHQNAAGAFAVGAAQYNNTPVYGVSPAIPESYSSKGGVPILFDTNGDRLSSPEIRAQPRAVGPDGTQTTFFYEFVDGKYYFFGTSAAAPHVAAVAALLLQQDPSLNPEKVYGILQDSADDMAPLAQTPDGDQFDFDTGYGFVNARRAFKLLSTSGGGGPKGGMDGEPGKGMRRGMMMMMKDRKMDMERQGRDGGRRRRGVD